jgi:hypothetical protein
VLVRADASNQIHIARIKSEIESGFNFIAGHILEFRARLTGPPNKSKKQHFQSVNNVQSEEMTDRKVSKVAKRSPINLRRLSV